MDNEMDKNDTVTDLTTGSVVPFMYAGQLAEQEGFAVDDTVNIPRGEYEDMAMDRLFLDFLEEMVGPEVWENANRMFDDWLEDAEDEMDGGTQV